MSMLRTAISRATLLAPRNVEKKAVRLISSVQGGPPGVKISKMELMIIQGLMASGIIAYPAWVIYHIEEYKRIAADTGEE